MPVSADIQIHLFFYFLKRNESLILHVKQENVALDLIQDIGDNLTSKKRKFLLFLSLRKEVLI